MRQKINAIITAFTSSFLMTDTYILFKSQKNCPPLWQRHKGILILKSRGSDGTIVGNIIFKTYKDKQESDVLHDLWGPKRKYLFTLFQISPPAIVCSVCYTAVFSVVTQRSVTVLKTAVWQTTQFRDLKHILMLSRYDQKHVWIFSRFQQVNFTLVVHRYPII